MELALNIPMSANPTRQKFWRVLRVVGIVFTAWSVVTGAHRLVTGFSAIVPPNDTVAIRIVRSDETIANLRSLTKGMNVVPGVPLSLADALSASDRALTIWYATDGTVTMVIDKPHGGPGGFIGGLDSFNEATLYSDYDQNITVISSNSTLQPLQKSIFKNILPTLLSGDSATLTFRDGRTNVSIEPGTITLHHAVFLAAPNIDEPTTENTVFSADIPAEDIATFVPRAFTQNTPGLSTLFTLASQNGVSAHIDRDADATTYTLAFPLTTETQALANEDSLTQIAKELVEVPTIDGITTFLSDGSKSITLRSREEASLLIRDETPYRFLTATSSYGTAYITQTPTLLTVSDHVQDTNTTQPRPASCLSGSIAFAQPKRLLSSLQSYTSYQPSLLSHLLWHTDEVASTLSTTRICIDE